MMDNEWCLDERDLWRDDLEKQLTSYNVGIMELRTLGWYADIIVIYAGYTLTSSDTLWYVYDRMDIYRPQWGQDWPDLWD